ncbi:MAG: dihydrofolate reductase family protein [Lachnospiraceae bacterium]|nr:dihydrofolate reductase family protein [Lachnospiraceae bacterium]
MRTVTLYIAMSLDGYIADRSGSVNWLHGYGRNEEVW